jgi:hypothetical protein
LAGLSVSKSDAINKAVVNLSSDEGFGDLVLDDAIKTDTAETLVEGLARLLMHDLIFN